MRLILLPVTDQRSLIYCQKLSPWSVHSKPRLDDRIAAKVAKLWNRFKSSDKKWKMAVTKAIEKLLDTVPFEENCLKTVPPLSMRIRQLNINRTSTFGNSSTRNAADGDNLPPAEVVYPHISKFPNFQSVKENVRVLTETALRTHRTKIFMCIAGLPLTIPFAINPFLPNIPGFYLVYRIWSNWKALKAAQHLQYLLKYDKIVPKNITELDKAYYESLASSPSTSTLPADNLAGTDDSQLGVIVAEQVKNLTPISSNTSKIIMTSTLAQAIDKIFSDEHLHSELEQAIRQTNSSRK